MRLLLLIIVGLMLTGCGLSRRTVQDSGTSPRSPRSQPPRAFTVSKYNSMEASLKQAYRDWKGTPYVLGGRSASGVDCSSFVSIVFDRYFGVELPMNTRQLMNRGEGVRRRAVRTGDLVFFKTGRRTFHVGVMVEGGDGTFLHASTSSGVMLSNIHEQYWADRYLSARRVI